MGLSGSAQGVLSSKASVTCYTMLRLGHWVGLEFIQERSAAISDNVF